MSYFSERKERISRLSKWVKENEFAAAVILKEEIESLNCNYLYYGGEHLSGEYGAIIIDSTGECYVIAQEYSFERVKSSGEYSKVYETRQSNSELIYNLKRMLDSKFPKGKIAIDSGTSVAAFELARSSGIHAQSNSLREFVFQERSVKSDYEISQIEKAIKTASSGLKKTIGKLSSGLSVDELTKILNSSMIDEGALSSSFETDIRIRSGVSEKEVRTLRSGDLILFDFGARLPSMYLSDIGRTIPFGNQPKVKDFFEDVFSIKREGLKKISSGKSGNRVREEIDKVILEHGYVSTHRPGHQIGLNVHEPYGPHLNYGKENEAKLETGNVVTWEPGIGEKDIKRPINRFGLAHMEDMVLVKSGGNSKMLGNLDLKYW
ncbi:MAG TPA: M24 family metallopeptidase [Nitrososphaerales archaeon]|nr:M24 family metallopeptidase [Nitrososphaerales archaeon]